MSERTFGLIGYPLSHSFSKKYFDRKFMEEGIRDVRYELFPLDEIFMLPALFATEKNLAGLNVTIPYKEKVLEYLDEVEPEVEQIGAVNTIAIRDGKLCGYNTDVYGFEQSLLDFLNGEHPEKALVLGTGGAAKAVKFVLYKMGIEPLLVSRQDQAGLVQYEQLGEDLVRQTFLIINTTPLGMSPKTDTCPKIPYEVLGENHYLYDLVYNPPQTLFLRHGEIQGAHTRNGLEMLVLQAEKAWEIWNEQT